MADITRWTLLLFMANIITVISLSPSNDQWGEEDTLLDGDYREGFQSENRLQPNVPKGIDNLDKSTKNLINSGVKFTNSLESDFSESDKVRRHHESKGNSENSHKVETRGPSKRASTLRIPDDPSEDVTDFETGGPGSNSNRQPLSEGGSPTFADGTPHRSRRAASRWGEETQVKEESEGEERWARAAISRQTTENQLHRPRNRNRDTKRRKVRVTEVEELVKAAIASTVSAVLRQDLEPLHTAFSVVRLDSFSGGIERQLGMLEHIQSKLLTEYGEMREAVTQATRTAQDLAQQVASLDAKVGILSRDVQSTKSSGGSASNSDSSSSSSSSSSGGLTRTEELKAVLMQASAAFSARLTATERRMKDDLGGLETRLTEAIKRSQLAFDTRLSSITADTGRILNRSCWNDPQDSSPPSHQPPFLSSNKLYSLDDTPSLGIPKFPHFSSGAPGLGFSSSSGRSFQSGAPTRGRDTRTRDGDLFDQADAAAAEQASPRSDQGSLRGDAVTLLPFPAWGRAEVANLAMVSRLATEIATQITKDAAEPARDCADVAAQGHTSSGVYTIHPAACSARVSLKAWCDLTTGGGGWTVIQRRGSRDSGRDDFFRDWAEYKWGFGDLESDHWIGNEYIYQLTSSGDYELRVDLRDWGDEERWAEYKHFHLSSEGSNYTLHIGDYKGNAGNSLKYHQGAPFSTKDRDNDINPMSHCARTFHGAWWFTACHESHLNGRYHRSPHRTYGDGINWMTFRGLNYSHKFSRMMIRPTRAASSQLSSSTVGQGSSTSSSASSISSIHSSSSGSQSSSSSGGIGSQRSSSSSLTGI